MKNYENKIKLNKNMIRRGQNLYEEIECAGKIKRKKKDFPIINGEIKKTKKNGQKNLSSNFVSYHIIPYHIILYHIKSYHIISYHTGSYHIISY